jgi:hypothetical protein
VHRSCPGLVLFSAVLACCCVGSAVAAPMGVVVATFALACMNNVDTPSGLSELLKGAAQLRPDDAKRFLKSNEGSAYWFKFDTGQMVAAIKEGGGCEIVSQEASISILSDLRKTILAVSRLARFSHSQGQTEKSSLRANLFRSATNSRHWTMRTVQQLRANRRHAPIPRGQRVMVAFVDPPQI